MRQDLNYIYILYLQPVVMLRPPAAPSSVPTPKPAQSKLAFVSTRLNSKFAKYCGWLVSLIVPEGTTSNL